MPQRFFLYGIVLFLYTLIPRIGLSQKVIDSLIKNLQNSPAEGVVISPTNFDNKIVTLPQEPKCFIDRHYYLWFKKKLVIQVDGTGQLYEFNQGKPAIRLDSSCYEGYNFAAFHFIYQDTIFSFGGYGFWMENGMLRWYDEKNGEWYVKVTGKTVPYDAFSAKFYYDVADKKIYLLYQKPTRIADGNLGARNYDRYVQCLDLLTKRWWNDPLPFNKAIDVKDFFNSESYLAGFHTKQGLLIDNGMEFSLFDFKNNRIKKIEHTKQTDIFNSYAKPFNKLLFSKDSSLQLFNVLTGMTVSIPFGDEDIVETDIPIYLPLSRKESPLMNSQQLISLSLAAALILLIGLAIVRFKKMRRKIALLTLQAETNTAINDSAISIENRQSFKANLTEAENNLLELLIDNSLLDTMTSVNQMNKVLGLAKKQIKIQNNLRAAAVLMINKKFKAYSGLPDDLVEKQRTEFDKRFFEYSIQRKCLSKVR
jgi:hypothetical protein